MCGIVGYIGNRDAQGILLGGLKRLEYRGYDSSGMCVYVEKKQALSLRKSPGKIKDLEAILTARPLIGTRGIAHTRWATHGKPNQVNAHPHFDCTGEIALVHNGIIENYAALKAQLIKERHTFSSQTDTEVLVHLIEKFYRSSPLEEAVRKTLSLVVGSFAIAVIAKNDPDKIVAARFGSPLVVGLGTNENFLASDVPALLDATKDVLYLEENEIAVLEQTRVRLMTLAGVSIGRKPVRVTWDISQAQKQGYPHFMLKEINEQPQVLRSLCAHRTAAGKSRVVFEELRIPANTLAAIKNIVVIACGTAYHAGMCGKYIIEEFCKVPVATDLSSEFRYRNPLIPPGTLAIAVSQSGETADTLAAVRQAKERGAKVLAICNVLGSSLVRESDGVIYTHAGPEIGVASTKAYTAQLATFYLFALYLAGLKKSAHSAKIATMLRILKGCAKLQEDVLKDQHLIKRSALKHSHFGSFLFLGRNINYPSALEGALKLKEISYIPAEGYAAGEMKHGPIALIDEYRAVVCIAPESKVYEKMVSNIQEIRARRGKIIGIASAGDDKIKELTPEVIYIPKVDEFFSPLIVALPLQLLAYHIAIKRGCDVDQPRNLAKSVTVE
jgi:glucosamine--fructose-6-phosphate aminotransferase (isomerizing)